MSRHKRSPKKPLSVMHLEGVIAGVLLECMRAALIANAREQVFENRCQPAAIREFWRERAWTHWDDYRQAWVIIDNTETGIASLVFYPRPLSLEGGQWAVHPFMGNSETNVTHEEAEQLALSLYKNDHLRRIPAAEYQ